MGIDWSQAPEGATHYRAAGGMYYGGFYRHEANGDWFFFVDGSWEFMGAPDESEAHPLIPRPTKPEPKEWDGETSFPPMGAKCEVQMGSYWYAGEVIGATKEAVWFKSDDRSDYWTIMNGLSIRPIRTQAERERIDTIVKAKYAAEDVVGFEVDEAICAALYDANLLRKPAEEVGREELAELSAKALTVRCGTMLEEWQYDTLADAILSKYNLTEK